MSVLKNIGALCFHRVGARCPVHANNCLQIVLHFAFDEALRLSIADDPRYTANPCTNPTVFFSRKKLTSENGFVILKQLASSNGVGI